MLDTEVARLGSRRTVASCEPLEDRRLFAVQLPPLSSLSSLTNAIQPPSHPALPASFDAFAPALSSSVPVSTTPTVAEWLRTAGPNQSVILTADQLASAGQTNAVVFGQTTKT